MIRRNRITIAEDSRRLTPWLVDLSCLNWDSYIFSGKKRLLPRPTDLSFLNWDTHHTQSNESPNFHIIPDYEQGLLFKNKRDRKVRAS